MQMIWYFTYFKDLFHYYVFHKALGEKKLNVFLLRVPYIHEYPSSKIRKILHIFLKDEKDFTSISKHEKACWYKISVTFQDWAWYLSLYICYSSWQYLWEIFTKCVWLGYHFILGLSFGNACTMGFHPTRFVSFICNFGLIVFLILC